MKRARQRPSLPSLPPSPRSQRTRHAAENTNKQRKQNRWVGLPPDRKKNAIFQISIHSFLCMAWHGMAWGRERAVHLSLRIISYIDAYIHTIQKTVFLPSQTNARRYYHHPLACLLACRFVINGNIAHPADPAMSVSLNARTLSVYLA